MNLNNFHINISQKIHEKGEEYYENDMIDNKDKHPVNIEVPLSPSQEQLTEILKHAKKKKLMSFLSQYADKHPDFYQALISNFQPKKKTVSHTDYAKEIKKCFKHSHHNYDFRFEGRAIAYKLDNYIEKAESMIKLNCEEEAVTILLHIIREIGENYEEYEDYDGDLAFACREATKLIAGMIKSGLPDILLKKMTDEISNLIKNSNYDNYDLADLDQIFFSICLKTANFDKGIHVLDEALKNEPDSFRTSSLVLSKINFLENAGKKGEIENVILSYLYRPEIRKIRLKELISKKQFEQALTLIDEGINLAEKKKHPGTVIDWKNEKLSVYQLMEI
jgi:tetratricopeptide (TPR) repeat protein